MVSKKDIVEAVNPRVTRVLTIAEAALPESQYKPFRKLVLDEFGKSGLEKELERLFGNRPRQER